MEINQQSNFLSILNATADSNSTRHFSELFLKLSANIFASKSNESKPAIG